MGKKAFFMFFSFFFHWLCCETCFFPPLKIDDWQVYITVFQKTREHSWFSHPHKSDRDTCDGQLGGWTFCAFQRQLSLCSLFVVPFCNLKAAFLHSNMALPRAPKWHVASLMACFTGGRIFFFSFSAAFLFLNCFWKSSRLWNQNIVPLMLKSW